MSGAENEQSSLAQQQCPPPLLCCVEKSRLNALSIGQSPPSPTMPYGNCATEQGHGHSRSHGHGYRADWGGKKKKKKEKGNGLECTVLTQSSIVELRVLVEPTVSQSAVVIRQIACHLGQHSTIVFLASHVSGLGCYCESQVVPCPVATTQRSLQSVCEGLS